MGRPAAPRWAWLPQQGSWAYHLLLAATGMLVLGPLAGVTAAYMNFSLGFFVGGQVLAGLLGSAVTAGYGSEGKHGANYIQTAAASVASMSGMGVLVQAMVWMGLPQPPAWQLVIYFACIGMFGVGVGMLYTPVLVDRMQLTFPSGLAVANILRALTDPALLRRSVGKLGGGLAAGLALGLAAIRVPVLGAIELSASTFGAGMVVGARIGIPAVTGGLIGWALQPFFVAIGWLEPGDPFRKITFLIALGSIMGAALVDLGMIFWRVGQGIRLRASA
ncbi:MAG TPA: OPT/YSL family transporter, partial [Ramlibacter sp.]|nr:OPT/YSL family transporter [Ramlibacter sp.]